MTIKLLTKIIYKRFCLSVQKCLARAHTHLISCKNIHRAPQLV